MYHSPKILTANTVAAILAALVLLVVVPNPLNNIQPVNAQFVRKPGATLKLCYFYFGTLQDLGYTFSFHTGRLQAQEELKALYKDIVIESIYEDNVFFSGMNRTQNLLNYVQAGCHVIITNGNENLMRNGDFFDFADWAATTYRNVSFLVGGDSNKPLKWTHPNMIWIGNDLIGGYYRAGVASGLEAQNCIGIIAAYENRIGININGFMRGVRSVNPTIPMHIVTTNEWWWPDGEKRIGQLLLDRGCNIIARNTDPRDVDLLVSARKTFGSKKYFSVGIHSNLQEYVGDTVLTAIYNNWVRIIVPWVRQVVETGMVQQEPVPKFYGLSGDYVRTAPISPLAAPSTIAAVEALGVVNESEVFCGFTKLRGTKENGEENDWTPSTPNGCMDIYTRRNTMVRYIDDPHTTYHPPFVLETSCPPGSSYNYTATGPIELTCTPCPANTFADDPGTAVCKPCEAGEESAPNSTKCTLIIPPTEAEFPYWIISIIGLVAICVAIVVVQQLTKVLKVANAPKDGGKPFAALFVGPKNISELWQRAPEDVPAAQDAFAQIVRDACKKHKCYEARRVGAFFLLTAEDPANTVRCAGEIQLQCSQFTWSRIFNGHLREHGEGCSLGRSSHTPGYRRRHMRQKETDDNFSESSRRSKKSMRSTQDDTTETMERSSRAGSESGQSAQLFKGDLKFEIAAGIQFGSGRISYDKEHNHYDYSGAVVDDAAHVIDIAQRGQTLVVECVCSLIDEDGSDVCGTFSDFTSKTLNGSKLKCQLMQFNSNTMVTLTFAEPLEGDENVDSVMNALQESKGGVTQKRVTVLCVQLVDFAVQAAKMQRDKANRKYKDIVEVVDTVVQLNRGVVQQFSGGEFIITFNAAFPTAGHTYRAGICASEIQSDLASLGIGTVVCGFDTGAAICGQMNGFQSQIAQQRRFGEETLTKPTHQAIVGTAVHNAVMLATLCSKMVAVDVNVSCLTTSKKVQDLSTALYYQYVDAISNIDAILDGEASTKPMGLVAVYGPKTTDEAECDEWLYELQNQNAGDPFHTPNECFEALLSGNVEKAKSILDATDASIIDRGLICARKIVSNFSTVDEYVATVNPLAVMSPASCAEHHHKKAQKSHRLNDRTLAEKQ